MQVLPPLQSIPGREQKQNRLVTDQAVPTEAQARQYPRVPPQSPASGPANSPSPPGNPWEHSGAGTGTRAGPNPAGLRSERRLGGSWVGSERKSPGQRWADGGNTDSRGTVTRECAEDTAGGNHSYQSPARAPRPGLTLSTCQNGGYCRPGRGAVDTQA